MRESREERARKLKIKKKLLHDKRVIRRFLSDKTSFNDYFKEKIAQYSDLKAVTDEYNNLDMTYSEVEKEIELLASGLESLGVEKNSHIGLFTENNGRWAICEHGILRCGAVAVLRGSNAPVSELDYIIGHSDSCGLIIKDGILLNSMKPYIDAHNLKFVILMFKSEKDDISGLNTPVYYFEDVLKMGENYDYIKPEQNLEEGCIILYTSGTTGNPKGVLLSHKNILFQIPSIELGFACTPGEKTLQILPVWHSYEHIAQSYYFTAGCHLHFSTLAGLKNDMAKYEIDALMSVPRIWEAIRLGIFQKLKQKSPIGYRIFDFAVKLSIFYKIHKMYSERRITNKKSRYLFFVNWYHKFVRSFLKPFHILFTKTLYKKIKTAVGMNFRASISGGGKLSMKDQLFYDAIGVNLREGYGLTETAPVLTLRNVCDPNFLGCCGSPLLATEIKIVDIDSGEELGIFKKGVVYARGGQVMKGYYKDEAATKAVIDENGWFNTGDLGWLTADNNLVLLGRAKETIVLSNGENVEPLPIEEACLESPYIEQIMLVGQDETSLGALVVPSESALQKCGILAKDMQSGSKLTIKNESLHALIKKEISTYIKNKQNLKPFEHIKRFEILDEDFTIKNGMLSQTAKIKRNNIFEKYKSLIHSMFEKK